MKTIGRDFGDVARKVYATASGVLPNGKPVVVNSDGTVSVAAETAASIGSEVVFEAGDSDWVSATYIGNDKVVIACADGGNSNQGTAVVGTVSGTSISFGTAVVFNASTTDHVDVETVGNNQVLVSYQDGGDSTNGNSRVGTVSGTNISFGTEVTFETAGDTMRPSAAYVSDGKAVLCFTADIGSGKPGKSRIASISGTDVSFGTVVTFLAEGAEYISTSYIGSDKFLVSFRNPYNSDRGEAIVGTISGTNVSFGSAANYNSEATQYVSSASVGNNQVVIAYSRAQGGDTPYYGKCVVATISGTSVTFGTVVVFNSSSTYTVNSTSVISRADGTAQISYVDVGNSSHGKTISGTISGTAITFGTPLVFAAASTREVSSAYIGNDKQVIAFRDNGNGGAGTAVVNQIGSTNLTTENYIGISSGGADPEIIGATSEFDDVSNEFLSSVYDPDNNRVILSYADSGNSTYGTAVVGAISGNSITFGTPVVFQAAACASGGITYDTTNNRVVITYINTGNSDYGTAVVGTATSSSISFGTPVVFQSSSTSRTTPCFDSNAGKVAIFYGGPSSSIRSRVGTVNSSNNSISYGTEVVVDAGSASAQKALYDSNSNKCVVFFKDSGNSGYGTSRVGTISGTDISFGTAVVFLASSTTEIGAAFDTANNKCIVSVRDEGSSDHGKAFVGTVSGTDISFGSAFTFHAAVTRETRVVYNSTKAQVLFSYWASSSNSRGEFVTANVSGTSFTDLSSASIFNGGASIAGNCNDSVFDPSSANVVLSFRDNASSKGLAQVVTTENRGEVASGGAVLVNTKGAINTNQGGLTAGQSYYVQTDGTITTTAGDPSVFAGTAVSATKLIVKG